jgi:GT2 family glycosyltransferase
MHVAVAIVGFRNPGDIAGCLEALARSAHTDFEVAICENGGHAAYEALRAATPAKLPGGQRVTCAEAPGNLGYAGGVNFAMALAPDADAWWVLNPDTLPEPAALGACVARLERGDCEAVGCTVYLPGGTVQSYGGRWQANLGRAVSIGHGRRLGDPVEAREVEAGQSYLNGACMLVGRRFLETVGPMREDYFLYCEEVEWCLRGLTRGMRLGFAADARVLHEAGTTTGSYAGFRSLPKTPVYLNERNRLLLTRDLSPARLPLVSLAALGVMTLRFGRRGAWRQLGYALSGWAAGLMNRRGPPAWIAV